MLVCSCSRYTVVGTAYWMAPEMLHGGQSLLPILIAIGHSLWAYRLLDGWWTPGTVQGDWGSIFSLDI